MACRVYLPGSCIPVRLGDPLHGTDMLSLVKPQHPAAQAQSLGTELMLSGKEGEAVEGWSILWIPGKPVLFMGFSGSWE